jgi:Glycosyl hydrolases family 43
MRPRRLLLTSMLMTLLGLAGVGQLTEPEAHDTTTVSSAGDTGEVTRSGAAATEHVQLTQGQLTHADVADPFVVWAEGRYWLYGTNSGGTNVPVYSSTDRSHWVAEHDALPIVPTGAISGEGFVWAPSVAHIADQYVLYVTVFDATTDQPCIATATSDRPDGPFVAGDDWRLECGAGAGGVIDASPVQDADGAWWLVFKNEGSDSVPNAIWSAPLSADGLTIVGSSTALILADLAWEEGTVEGPSMIPYGDGYLLTYSGARWNTSAYSTGVAWCATVTGSCTKLDTSPVLASSWGGDGPGGAELFTDASGTRWVVYHQRDPGVTGKYEERRPYLIALRDLCDEGACGVA